MGVGRARGAPSSGVRRFRLCAWLESLCGEPCLRGEFGELRVAASVQRDQDSEHFAAHQMSLGHLGGDVPCPEQRGLCAVSVTQVELGVSGVDMDRADPGG
jgi:hypothetical protein